MEPSSDRNVPHGERIARVEGWVVDHDKLCAERYGDLKSDMAWLIRGVFGILLAICAWCVIQVWNGRNTTPAPTPVTVIQPVIPR